GIGHAGGQRRGERFKSSWNGRDSRRETIYDPAALGVGYVAQAVMQARRAALPEFEYGRYEAVAAPVRRARGLVAIAIAELLLARFECGTSGGLALFRCPGTE